MTIKRKRLGATDIANLVGTDIEKQAMRQVRSTLLAAFDIWEKGVIRGREADSSIVMGWYRDLLDLKASAFANVPEAIKKHL